MTRTVPDTLTPTAHRSLRLALLPAATLLLATGAQAQSPNCDQLRQRLSQGIEAGGVRGYALDILPAKAPAPSGGKVIGTCDGGAYKAVYRRFGGPVPAEAIPPGAAAPLPAPAPPPAPAPTPVAMKPAPKPEPEQRPAPPPPPPPPPPAVKVPEPAPPPPAPAPEPAPAPAVVVAVAEPPVASAPATLAAAQPAAPQPEAATVGIDWNWLWALLLLPLVFWFWSWANHRRQYDAAGLPRGPRL
jgi:Protein of unknown function (DUF1161)